MNRRTYIAETTGTDPYVVRKWTCADEATARQHFARIGEPYGVPLRLIGPTGLVITER